MDFMIGAQASCLRYARILRAGNAGALARIVRILQRYWSTGILPAVRAHLARWERGRLARIVRILQRYWSAGILPAVRAHLARWERGHLARVFHAYSTLKV
jgi:hypothetical protein